MGPTAAEAARACPRSARATGHFGGCVSCSAEANGKWKGWAIDPWSHRLGWELERFFKLGKSGSGLHELPSANEDIVRTLIYAALCRATVSMRGCRTVQAILGSGRANHLHARSWNRLWLLHAHAALRILLPPRQRIGRDQLRRLWAEASPARWCTLTSFAEAA